MATSSIKVKALFLRLAPIVLLSIVLRVGVAQTQCQAFDGKLNLNPNRPICVGANVTGIFTTSFPIFGNLSWSYSGGGSPTVTPLNPPPFRQCKLGPVTAQGTFVVTGTVIIGSTQCPFTSTMIVKINNLVAEAGPNQPITQVPVTATLGGAPTASLGASSYSYAWVPATGLSTSGQVSANPTLTPTSNLGYTVTVTDADGCTASDYMQFYYLYSYGELKRSLGADYYQVFNGKLYFTLDREYSNASQLKYRIYDELHYVRTDYLVPPAPSLSVTRGDNRFLLDLSGALSYTAADNNKFFTLEVTNEKNEISLLKFRYAQ